MKACYICNQDAVNKCSICRRQICNPHSGTAEKRILCSRCVAEFVQDGKIKIKTSLLEWITYFLLFAVMGPPSIILIAEIYELIKFPLLVVKISVTVFWSFWVYLAIIVLFFIEHFGGKSHARISLSQEYWRSYGMRGYFVMSIFYSCLIFSVWMMIAPWIFEIVWQFFRFNLVTLSIFLFNVGFVPLLVGFIVSVSIWLYELEKNRKKREIRERETRKKHRLIFGVFLTIDIIIIIIGTVISWFCSDLISALYFSIYGLSHLEILLILEGILIITIVAIEISIIGLLEMYKRRKLRAI